MKVGEKMARPAKAVKVQSKNLTTAEREAREFLEDSLKGTVGNPVAPKYLTKSQRKIFKKIVDGLAESGILGTLDAPILTTCAIAIDRLAEVESMINEDPTLLRDAALMSAKDKYTKDLYRCCNELCLSPQARAKIGSLAAVAAKQKEDPLVAALSEDD